MSNNTNDIINSLDGMARAEAPGFFYAGIRAKMERGLPAERPVFSLKPVFITLVLFIFLVANLSVLSGLGKKETNNAPSGPGIESFAKEYNLSIQTIGE